MTSMTPPVQVAICIPSGRQWEADMAIRLSAISARATAQGIRTITINEKNSIVSLSRNSMAENALRLGASHIFWCDTDNTPPIGVIKRFLDLDKDIVGGVYCKRVPPYDLLGIPKQPTDLSEGGVVPYWLLPGGCVMVKAKVYRTMPKPWYFDSIRREGTPVEHFARLLEDHYHLAFPAEALGILVNNDSFLQWAHEEEELNKSKYGNGTAMGEDYNFCLKAQRYGFEVWGDLDTSFELGHIGETTVMMSRPNKSEESVEPK